MGVYGLLFEKVKITTGDERPEMFSTARLSQNLARAVILMNTLNSVV